jgi:hypothetical protein
MKPGAYLAAFGGARTFHRMACAIENAGFEIRDTYMYIYNTGFPKSLDVSKAIDRAAGAERQIVGSKIGMPGVSASGANRGRGFGRKYEERIDHPAPSLDITAPTTPEAAKWQGFGTALKPSYEPVILARKPLIGTVVENVLRHGTGALNIDATRLWCTNHGPRLRRGRDGSIGSVPPAPSGWFCQLSRHIKRNEQF